MNRIKIMICLLLAGTFSGFPNQPNAVDKELIIAQMNSCVNTLTNIINNKSMAVLDHETDQLLNNLTIQQLVGLPEIAEFRVNLIDGIGSLGITEEEKALLKRITSIKKDNLKWQALSGALNNTMLVTGGGNVGMQLGFQSLLTAARAAVEYKTASNDLQIEELQAMWELRKEDLKTFVNLRKEALGIIFSLYQKYNLKESDRLTEQSAQQFQKIISEPDAHRMVRLLNDNYISFGHMADYHYYLGMGYLDCGDTEKANQEFKIYEELYKKAPIYRIDEKSGLIALARLSHFTNMPEADIRSAINAVVYNLPSNSMAITQCALVYDKVLNDPRSAINLLRSALDNDRAIDKTAILLTASAIIPRLTTFDKEYVAFWEAYNNQTQIDLDAELNLLISKGGNVWNFLQQTVALKGLASRPWYRSKWVIAGFFCNQSVNIGKKITFSIPSKYSIDLTHVKMWVEKHEDKEVKLTQYNLHNPEYIQLKDIEDVDCFKSNPNLKYLYMETSETEGEYRIKPNIDFEAIEREDYPRQSEFTLTEDDIKDIVKFLKKHTTDNQTTNIIAKRGKFEEQKYTINGIEYIVKGDSINLTDIRNTQYQDGISYMKFQFDDLRHLELCYKYDNKNECLTPCYIQYLGKRYFSNPDLLIEFGYKTLPVETPTEEKEDDAPWYTKLWDSISGWWSGLTWWSWIVNLF